MTFVRVGGVPHHVVVEGSGPVCVLSAGLAMSWFDWDQVVPLLAPYRTVVRFDRPGHGLSGPAAVPPSAAGEGHRIADILDALGLDGPSTVVGHSIAGFHAEAFARLHPARTAAVVLLDSSIEEHARVPAAPAVRTAVAHGVGNALSAAGIPAALGPLTRRAVVRLSRTGGGDPAPAALVRRCYATSRVLQGALLENTHYLAVAAELLALRERHALPGAPVAVLAATAGGARWVERQRTLARQLGARFEAVDPAGHLMMLDRPDAVARAVLDAGDARDAGEAVREERPQPFA
ncbi:alpha/beta hydrolase [Streptomyces lunaelactis]|uniref:alpha/beta fold hydrolase n=1 Tax=Streptomyces lunaelactis TaxID=1535768 RepID=UPI0015853047|nr:alpha/beta hydrolase [Streptomyces lunaelactis]NUK11435.1 alpha/beta hydrolase [Streptomyces lunaelactis]NUK18926.1 alpha/beta hydrolase [Streptomyces lunaelactis]NUK26371.1 alpha/beta hydrolase [Streptomyces lunaelactis]NUK37721.1 alpha/beta hydrolase [Streptomyces lunaelactis]NUK44500.1 alpha/beta hydrolase [Streptomyces lunaelactis]